MADAPIPKPNPISADKRYGKVGRTPDGKSIRLGNDPDAPPVAIDYRSDKQLADEKAARAKQKATEDHNQSISDAIDTLTDLIHGSGTSKKLRDNVSKGR